MEAMSIMMITIPIYMPIAHALGFEPLWFSVVLLISTEMAGITPPFGISLFVMKAVAPPDTTMGDIYRAALPFAAVKALSIVVVIAFPVLATWLPGLIMTR